MAATSPGCWTRSSWISRLRPTGPMRCSPCWWTTSSTAACRPTWCPIPGMNSGFKGMQLSITSLTCAIRQMAGPSSIHSLPTEQYNQDVVSLGMHSAVTAADALECLRNCDRHGAVGRGPGGGPARWSPAAGAGKPPYLRRGAAGGGIPGSRPAHGRRHRRARAGDTGGAVVRPRRSADTGRRRRQETGDSSSQETADRRRNGAVSVH